MPSRRARPSAPPRGISPGRRCRSSTSPTRRARSWSPRPSWGRRSTRSTFPSPGARRAPRPRSLPGSHTSSPTCRETKVSAQPVRDELNVLSALWQPVIRNGVPIGVLTLAWEERVADPGERVRSLIALLAAEAAVAIERADLLARLETVARTDDLTGLANRRAWDEHLPRELSRAGRDGSAAVRGHARPGSVQGVQRRARPPGRRPPAQAGVGRVAGDAAPLGHAGALRRRGVQPGAAQLPDREGDGGRRAPARVHGRGPDRAPPASRRGTAKSRRTRWSAAPTRRSTRPRRPDATGRSRRARALQYPGWDSNPHGPKATAF